MAKSKTVVVTTPVAVVGYGQVAEGLQELPADTAALLIERKMAVEPTKADKPTPQKEGE